MELTKLKPKYLEVLRRESWEEGEYVVVGRDTIHIQDASADDWQRVPLTMRLKKIKETKS